MSAITLLDGGLGQEIYRRAGKPAHPLWSVRVMMERPEIVASVHQDFIRAGSRVITTNNYTATPTRLRRDGNLEGFAPLQRQALKIAQDSRDKLGATAQDVQIAGCLPPLVGSYVTDTRSFTELREEYVQLVAIQGRDVDIFLVETMADIPSARAALEAVQGSGKPVCLSLTLSDTAPRLLRSGATIEEALKAIAPYSPRAITLNCSFPETIDQGIEYLSAGDIPYGGYANGFTSVEALQPGGTVEVLSARTDLNKQQYATHALRWIHQGASVIGGCCEVGPGYIAHLRDQILAAGFSIEAF